jgi:hypothetical protein
MANQPNTHNIDVGIRTIVMTAARTRLNQIREREKQQNGVPTTTMASVGRGILTNWSPEDTSPVGKVEDVPVDAAGNRLTQRGHRKYTRRDKDAVPPRAPGISDATRAGHLLTHLQRVSDPARGTTLGPIGAVKKAATAEDLLDVEVAGKTLRRHIGAAERRVLKPLRFTLPEDVYQLIATKMESAGCTITRALEVGLEKFARTGKTDSEG